MKVEARRWLVRGRVQGVGYRYFAQKAALSLGLRGYTRNLDDGRVQAMLAAARSGLYGIDGRRVLDVWRGLRPDKDAAEVVWERP